MVDPMEHLMAGHLVPLTVDHSVLRLADRSAQSLAVPSALPMVVRSDESWAGCLDFRLAALSAPRSADRSAQSLVALMDDSMAVRSVHCSVDPMDKMLVDLMAYLMVDPMEHLMAGHLVPLTVDH